ncbi:MAG: hypothetical protein WC586_04995 [Methanoregula sp.]
MDTIRDNENNVGVVIISGSCCIPGMASLDELTQHVVDLAISKSGVRSQVKIIPASSAYHGSIPKETMNRILTEGNQPGRMPFPAIIVNGDVVSYGVPKIDDLVKILLQKKEETSDTRGYT